MKVQLNRKESSYSKLPELYIAASEIVSDETFEQMQAHPLWDHDVIQKHIQDMRSVAGGEYCLLIAPENGTDGLLVRSEGSSCARYSAYIPGGRLMTLVTPELERALRKCETAAKEAVRRECMQTLTGKWTCSLAELDAAFGAGLQENKILVELFCDKLARHIWKEICCESDSGRNVVRGLRIVEGSVFCGLNRADLYGRSKSKTDWKHSRKA